MKTRYTSIILSFFFLSTNAQTPANAGFETWPGNCPVNTAPTSWSNFSTSLGPDQAGTCAGTVVSQQGISHMNLVWSNTGLAEGADQLVSGFTTSTSYSVNFYAIEDRGLYASTGSVFLDVYVNSVVVFSTPELFNLGPWTMYSANFVSSGISQTIGFRVRAGGTGTSGSVGVDDVTIVTTTGIKNNLDPSLVTIFPNPVQHQLNITMPPDLIAKNISIHSIYGQLVYALTTGDMNVIQLPELAPGIYFVRINTSKGEVTKRISVE